MDAHPTPDLPVHDLVAESPPEHAMPGRTLILLVHAVGWTAFVALAFSRPVSSETAALAVFGALFPLFGAYLGEALRRFECWSWFFAIPLLCAVGLTMLANVGGLPAWEAACAATFSIPLLGWIHYLWVRRWQFWSEWPARPRPVRRRVSPAWRAARLARIGAGRASPARSLPSR